jgi:hypothetical protein
MKSKLTSQKSPKLSESARNSLNRFREEIFRRQIDLKAAKANSIDFVRTLYSSALVDEKH